MPGRGGVGPLRFGGDSLCWGRSVTFHSHRSVGIPKVRCVHLARQHIALPRPWLPLRMDSSVSRDLRSHVSQMWESSDSLSRPMILNLISSPNSVSWHFRKQHGNLYMTAQSILKIEIFWRILF